MAHTKMECLAEQSTANQQSWALVTNFATTRQCRKAKKLSLDANFSNIVALSLIFRILSRCRCCEEILLRIRDKYRNTHLIWLAGQKMAQWVRGWAGNWFESWQAGSACPHPPPLLNGRTEIGPVGEGMGGKLVRVMAGRVSSSPPPTFPPPL